MREELVMVPHLQDAAFYDLMVVFTKCRVGFVDKLAGVAPLYSLHGHLADMVARAATDLPSLLDMCSSPAREEVSWPDFSHTWSRGGRSVTVSLSGLTKLVTNWTMAEGELVLDTGVEGLLEGGKVYIITEVVYAHTVKVEVVTGERKVTEEVGGGVPVAFSYFKFPVSKEGVVRAAVGGGGVRREMDFLLVEEGGGGGAPVLARGAGAVGKGLGGQVDEEAIMGPHIVIEEDILRVGEKRKKERKNGSEKIENKEQGSQTEEVMGQEGEWENL